ncbi:hypothetical protein F4677DRAFT_270157 [Hypoxylon crocopeplum]|nr:hypothetical protein F4677DRAFT_270157 [Hypoxylon crocopeplum]
MTNIQETSASLVKKRARDRRAQQNLRNKRVAYVETLELRTAALETELQSLQRTCYSLRQENEILRGRQEYVQHIVASWTPHESECLGSNSTDVNSILGRVNVTSPPGGIHPGLDTDDGGGASSRSPSTCHQTPPESRVAPAAEALQHIPRPLGDLTLPRWSLTPAHVEGDLIFTDCFTKCLRRPDLVRASPETPQPIDFLYGSKTNFLANTLHDTTRRWPCRDPERLATGWLIYHLIRWMIDPSEARFSRLHDFQKPVPEQLCQPHPYFVDFALWPKFRSNLVTLRDTYILQDVVGMLSCCLRVRWPWNKAFLEPDDNGRLVLRADFYNTFTRLEGWGLTEEFIDRFPSLVAGLDPASIRYDFVEL